jgi:hypothetical protein
LFPEPWPQLSFASLTIAMSKQFWVRDITMKACSSASMSATLSLEVPFNLRDRVKRCEEWGIEARNIAGRFNHVKPY